jgi:hypothetical protein
MTSSYSKKALLSGRTITIKSFFGSLIGVVLALLVFTGCEEDPSEIGGSILPVVDFENVSATDTFTVEMYTMFTDTIRSVDPYTIFLGNYDDLVFGTTSSAAVSQLWLYSDWPGNGILSVDSIKLFLQVDEVLGEMTGNGTLNIYEIDEYLDSDSIYYVNRDVPVKGLLGSVEIAPFTGDSLITFDLPIAAGELLLRDTSMLFLSSGLDDFRTFFNGLYFEYIPSSNDHLLSVDLVTGITFINVYYTNSDSTSTAYTFNTNSKCVRYNRFIHDFSTADLDKRINHINDGFKDTLSYIQSLQGVYTKVVIPGLEKLKESMPLGINKARLAFPAYFNEDYFPEENLFTISLLARYNNSDGLRTILPDYELSTVFFDGDYYGLDYEYRINIINFVQKYLEGEIDEPTFELFLPSNSINNLILRSNNPLYPVKLEMVFSKF